MEHIKNQWISGQPHRGHLAALAGWRSRYVALSFHHFSFRTVEFLKDKCYQKVPVSAYINCTESLISSGLGTIQVLRHHDFDLF